MAQNRQSYCSMAVATISSPRTVMYIKAVNGVTTIQCPWQAVTLYKASTVPANMVWSRCTRPCPGALSGFFLITGGKLMFQEIEFNNITTF